MPCTTVTNFCSEGDVMLLLSIVRYQVLLFVLDTYDTDAISINKLCKLNFRYFTMYITMYLTISQQQGYQGFLKVVFTF